MYKNIEILNKEKFKKIKFSPLSDIDVAKNVGLIPLGFSEILEMNFFAPILIMGEQHKEFFAFTGISKDITIFLEPNIYIPKFIQTYPFVTTTVKYIDNKYKNLLSIDYTDMVNQNAQFHIFDQYGNFQTEAKKKVDLLKELTAQRDGSKKIIDELTKYNLLVKKDFKIKYGNEQKVILENFYIIDRKKLIDLDDTILAKWAKKGWMSIIDCHIKSLSNFHKVIRSK